ncbi:MAG: hypothetical protein ACRDT8_12565, partial [Micromonosporaceae bacterium]
SAEALPRDSSARSAWERSFAELAACADASGAPASARGPLASAAAVLVSCAVLVGCAAFAAAAVGSA